jgi:hypothetical protein
MGALDWKGAEPWARQTPSLCVHTPK